MNFETAPRSDKAPANLRLSTLFTLTGVLAIYFAICTSSGGNAPIRSWRWIDGIASIAPSFLCSLFLDFHPCVDAVSRNPDCIRMGITFQRMDYIETPITAIKLDRVDTALRFLSRVCLGRRRSTQLFDNQRTIYPGSNRRSPGVWMDLYLCCSPCWNVT